MTNKVLVTGGNGFLGLNIVCQLLKDKYVVRTTLRSLEKKATVIQTLKEQGLKEELSNLEFIQADLQSDKNWNQAMAGIDYVISVASPVFFGKVDDEQKAIQPAVQGITRIIMFAQKAGVKRIVMTANFGAVGFSNKDKNSITTEKDWTNVNEKGLSLYEKSKAIAEQKAWKLINDPKNKVEFTTVNAVAMLGPSLDGHISGSFSILNNILNGSMKRIPQIELNVVDVRDVAKMHILAMTNPKAAGQRFIASADGKISMPEIARLIRSKRPKLADKIPTKVMPNWLINIAASFNQTA